MTGKTAMRKRRMCPSRPQLIAKRVPQVRVDAGSRVREVWNEIDDETKNLKPSKFTSEVKKYLLNKYN